MSELDAYLGVCTDLALVGGVSSIRDYSVSKTELTAEILRRV